MLRTTRRGFSIAELLVVIAIIGVMVALLLPATRRVRGAATRSACMNNLKQLMLALHNYESTHGKPDPTKSTGEGGAPVGAWLPPGCLGSGNTPEERLSWLVALLPHLEQEPLYGTFDREAGFAANEQPAQATIKTFLCPSTNAPPATTTYVSMAGIGRHAAEQPVGAEGNGFMGYDRRTSLEQIPDGTSHTIALMETQHALGSWARGGPTTLRGFDPSDWPWYGEQRPFGGHESGIQIGMADASVRFLSGRLDANHLAAAITIAGREPVQLD